MEAAKQLILDRGYDPEEALGLKRKTKATKLLPKIQRPGKW